MSDNQNAKGGGIVSLALHGQDPRGWGQQHGEHFRAGVRELYDIRIGLTLQRMDLVDEKEVLALAAKHIPVLQDFDEALYQETCGIADATDLSVEQILLLNHYTDFRDLSKSALRAEEEAKDDGGCSVIFKLTDEGPLLSQTWDMHGTATNHVMLLEVPGKDGEEKTLLFSIHGCLGMTGLTSSGLGMTINNLNSVDATIGVMWPALVRRCLREGNAKGALEVLQNAKIGSGHHYVVADEHELFGLTTSGQKKKLLMEGHNGVHLHTNHVVDDEMAATCRVPEGSSSFWRRDKLEALKAGAMPSSSKAIYDSFDDVSMALSVEDPHKSSTCGAVLMNLRTKEMWACKGLPKDSAPAVLSALGAEHD
ncbi:MAG: hypothetical protein GY822_21400 [Deltaproteobacteria bacterium]|nr:hypothetical protein [Deltaproteobacteria bacterium]